MKAPFEVGDVVVCVDELGPNLESWEPKFNTHYRIVECVEAGPPIWEDGASFADDWGVVLVEDPRNDDTLWPAKMFRKIDSEVTEAFRRKMRSLTKKRERTE